jgi:hypothetical protein
MTSFAATRCLNQRQYSLPNLSRHTRPGTNNTLKFAIDQLCLAANCTGFCSALTCVLT